MSGVFGVPASIAQLTVMLFLYRHLVGPYGFIALNALWVLNFEMSLVRNFLLSIAGSPGAKSHHGAG